jgi:hypothetical protein
LPPFPPDLGQRPKVVLEDREELHGHDRTRAEPILHDGLVRDGAPREPLQVVKPALDGLFAIARQRSISHDEPQAFPSVQ